MIIAMVTDATGNGHASGAGFYSRKIYASWTKAYKAEINDWLASARELHPELRWNVRVVRRFPGYGEYVLKTVEGPQYYVVLGDAEVAS